jgi:hypothetical protein
MNRLFITSILLLLIASCEKKPQFETGEGFEIYLTVTPYAFRFQVDYHAIDFDTIALQELPALRYNDLLAYDTVKHKLTLGIPSDSLHIGDSGVYGRMFVVTIDREPIYCGFYWPVISSVGSDWIVIEEPYKELDHLEDNEIVINCRAIIDPDPRKDARIISRLEADGKVAD